MLSLQQRRKDIATGDFSVPDDVKERFNKAFPRQNKSRIIADLMNRAVEERPEEAPRQGDRQPAEPACTTASQLAASRQKSSRGGPSVTQLVIDKSVMIEWLLAERSQDEPDADKALTLLSALRKGTISLLRNLPMPGFQLRIDPAALPAIAQLPQLQEHRLRIRLVRQIGKALAQPGDHGRIVQAEERIDLLFEPQRGH